MLPETAIPRDPRVGRAHRPHHEAAAAHPPILAPDDEPGALQDAEVAGDGGERHPEGPRQRADRRLAGGEPGEDGAPDGIGERGEGRVEGGRATINHMVKYYRAGESPSRGEYLSHRDLHERALHEREVELVAVVEVLNCLMTGLGDVRTHVTAARFARQPSEG